MLTLFSGAFSDLENSFINRIKSLKSDPFSAVAVIAPSSLVSNHLQIALARTGWSALNIHFHSLLSFAEKVVSETEPLEKPILSDGLFLDTLVKITIKEDKPFRSLADLAVPRGFPPAVRSTLRDLVDAGAPPTISKAVKEGFLGKDVDVGSLRELLRLYTLYLKRLDSLPIFTRAALTQKATQLTLDSPFLKQFKEVVFYGFYDMTGIQTDFFQGIAKACPSSFFFPYVSDEPAYAFAGRFRDTFLQPVAHDEIRVTSAEVVGPKDFEVLNVSGLNDEAWIIAQEIRRCHDELSIPYSDIAVIYRSKDRITPGLLKSLRDHFIPYRSTVRMSLASSPLIEMTNQKLRDSAISGPDWASEETWEYHIRKTTDFLKRLSAVSHDGEEILSHLLEAVETLAVFSQIKRRVSRQEFLETLEERWAGLDLPDPNASDVGVSVLHAEAARGLNFRLVFLAGLEDRVFPRVIREDPFLRDDARIALSNTLGYKISQKSNALEEERLLFRLIISVAKQKIYFVYQRSDDEGRVIGPSPFLRDFLKSRDTTLEKAGRTVPRPYLDKIRSADPRWLAPQHVVSGLLEANQSAPARDYLKSIGMSSDFLDRQLMAMVQIESRSEPTAYDGLVGELETKQLFRHGALSPTSLESYGECPFRYFASRLLDLEPLEEKIALDRMAPDVRGKLVHAFLERFYKALFAEKKPKQNALFEKTFSEVFEEVPAADVNLHPILWTSIKAKLKADLKNFVDRDLEDCARLGFVPTHFEKEIVSTLPAPLDQIQWRGILDRVDLSKTAARVVDYKTMKRPISGKIATLALRGRRLQPPLYILLLETLLKDSKDTMQLSFVYKRLAHDEPDKEFSTEDWQANRDEILKSVEKQLQLLRKGVFLIHPDDDYYADAYCGWCDMSQICRKNHGPTQWRAKKGDGAQLRELRSKKSVRLKGAKGDKP